MITKQVWLLGSAALLLAYGCVDVQSLGDLPEQQAGAPGGGNAGRANVAKGGTGATVMGDAGSQATDPLASGGSAGRGDGTGSGAKGTMLVDKTAEAGAPGDAAAPGIAGAGGEPTVDPCEETVFGEGCNKPRLRRILATGSSSCLLDAQGAMKCWGNTPWASEIPATGEFVSLSGTNGKWCALASTGQAACAMVNPAPSDSFVSLEEGGEVACGLHADGTVKCTAKPSAGVASS